MLGEREGKDTEALRREQWQVAQELAVVPGRPAVVYPAPYRRAILS